MLSKKAFSFMLLAVYSKENDLIIEKFLTNKKEASLKK